MGTIIKVPFEEYLKVDALSGSDIVNLSRTALDFKKGRAFGKEKTHAMKKGTLLHCMVLEPELYERTYCIEPSEMPDGTPIRKPASDGSMRKTKEGKAFLAEWEAANAGKTLIDASDYKDALIQREAILSNPEAVDLLKRCEWKEHALFWERDGIACKGQIDGFGPGLLMDLKTTANIHPDNFEADSYRRKYHQKMAWYREGMRACGYAAEEVSIISVCFDECIVRPMTEQLLDRGDELNAKALEKYKRCLEQNDWPGWPSSMPLGLPQWALFDMGEG